jgi:hypothetical protein
LFARAKVFRAKEIVTILEMSRNISWKAAPRKRRCPHTSLRI